MVIFHSYVSIPEGNILWGSNHQSDTMRCRTRQTRMGKVEHGGREVHLFQRGLLGMTSGSRAVFFCNGTLSVKVALYKNSLLWLSELHSPPIQSNMLSPKQQWSCGFGSLTSWSWGDSNDAHFGHEPMIFPIDLVWSLDHPPLSWSPVQARAVAQNAAMKLWEKMRFDDCGSVFLCCLRRFS